MRKGGEVGGAEAWSASTSAHRGWGRNRTNCFPEEFRAPKAYESLGGTNPRAGWTALWRFRGKGAAQHGRGGEVTGPSMSRFDHPDRDVVAASCIPCDHLVDRVGGQ